VAKWDRFILSIEHTQYGIKGQTYTLAPRIRTKANQNLGTWCIWYRSSRNYIPNIGHKFLLFDVIYTGPRPTRGRNENSSYKSTYR